MGVITCHLGSGGSICAVEGGKSIDTTMGFTPLDGLMMGTRSGSLDPAIVTYLMRHERLTYDEMDRILNKKSGILGISGSSADMRDVTEAAHAGDERAELAIDMYVHAVQKAIGSYYALMTHTDAVVLTAGIGENSAELRERIFAGLAHMGMILDKERNDFTGAIGEDRIVSIDDSPIKIFVVTADEEMRIARDTAALVSGEEVR
jgi:acetate kinase